MADVTPNAQQVQDSIRTLLAAVAGAALNHGIISGSTFSLIMGSLAILVPWIWGILTHTKSNQVATVDAMPEISGVVTTKTPDGAKLAASIPSTTVVMAGTPDAAAVAKT